MSQRRPGNVTPAVSRGLVGAHKSPAPARVTDALAHCPYLGDTIDSVDAHRSNGATGHHHAIAWHKDIIPAVVVLGPRVDELLHRRADPSKIDVTLRAEQPRVLRGCRSVVRRRSTRQAVDRSYTRVSLGEAP